MHKYYEFDIKLLDAKPVPTRQFVIHHRATFHDLHEAIQDAFAWYGGHLWDFGSARRVLSDIADCEGQEGPLASRVTLRSYFGEEGELARKAYYTYDYGDCWEHLVTLKRVVLKEDATHWRQLLAGKHMAPPEDCGGTPGYMRIISLLETGQDPWGESEADIREFLDHYNVSKKDLTFDLARQCALFDVLIDPKVHKINKRKKAPKKSKHTPKRSVRLQQQNPTHTSKKSTTPTTKAPAQRARTYSTAELVDLALPSFFHNPLSPDKREVFTLLERYLTLYRTEDVTNTHLGLCGWIHALIEHEQRGGGLKTRKPQIHAAAVVYWLDTLFGVTPSFNRLAERFGVSGPSIKTAYLDLCALFHDQDDDATREDIIAIYHVFSLPLTGALPGLPDNLPDVSSLDLNGFHDASPLSNVLRQRVTELHSFIEAAAQQGVTKPLPSDVCAFLDTLLDAKVIPPFSEAAKRLIAIPSKE